MNDLFSEMRFSLLLMSILKSVIFGLIIAITASYEGMRVGRASTEVPQATIRTVVRSIFTVIIVNIVVTWIFWMLLI